MSYACVPSGSGLCGLGAIAVPARPSGAGAGAGGGTSSAFPIPIIPGDFNVSSAAGPLVDAMMPLIAARIPEVITAASPAIQAEIVKAMPGVRDELGAAFISDLRNQAMVGLVFQTAVILGVGWYFLRGPGARGGI